MLKKKKNPIIITTKWLFPRLISWVTLSKSLNLSKAHCPWAWNKDNNICNLTGPYDITRQQMKGTGIAQYLIDTQ